MSGVGVEYDTGGHTKTVYSDSDGDYGIYALTSGYYTLTYSKNNYQGSTQSASLANDSDNITVATLSMISNSCTGGNISGQIKNAVNRDNVSDVLVSLRSGFNVRSGSTISGKTATTVDNGTYTISSVDAGLYTAEASKSGFITSYYNVSSCTGASNQNTNLSETLADGAMRIVLSWRGEEDMDAHLEIPVDDVHDNASDNTDSTHLSYKTDQDDNVTFTGVETFDYHIYTDIVSSGDYVTLDQDNKDGIVASCPRTDKKCGPETMTISKVRSSGTYRYHVHVWSQKGKDDNTTHLADNGTYVQVFYNNESYNFDVPNRSGDLWTVFDFDNRTGFTQINIMGTEGSVQNVDDH